MESRARAYGRDGLGYNIGGELAHKFGAGRQFGVYVSGFYDIRHFVNSMIGGIQEAHCCDYGTDFAQQDAAGNSAPGLDPAKNLILTGANFGVSEGYTERYSGNASFDWHADDGTTIYLRATYAEAISEQNSNLTQIVATDKQDGSKGTPIGPGLYAPVLGSVATKFWYETNPQKATLGTVQLGGKHDFGRLNIAPNIFYSWGQNSRPNHIEVAAATPYGGSTLFGYADKYPQPLLTPAMQDIPGMSAAGGSIDITDKRSTQKKFGGQIDLRYDFGEEGVLRYVKFGGKLVQSRRTVTKRGYGVAYGDEIQTLDDLGIVKGAFSPVFPGRGYDWSSPYIDLGALFDLYNRLAEPLGGRDGTITSCGGDSVNAFNCNTQKARETVSAGYVLADLKTGDLELIPGFRFEHTDVHSTFWYTPSDDDNNRLVGHFEHSNATFDEALPSLLLNYRPDSRSVVRGAIWTSYVRPPFLQLGGGATESVTNSGGNRVVTITQGNPDLKPIRALNLDLSAERSFPTGTRLSVAGYYKRLRNYIYDAGTAAGVQNQEGTGGTVTVEPANGGSGDVYGFEVSFQQRFSAMPAPFDGLGIGGNFTRQWTRVDLLGDGTRMERIQNAPDYLANAQLFYEQGPFTFDLIYNYSGAYVSDYDTLSKKATWDDVWVRPAGRVDLHAGWRVTGNAKLDLSISNLFNTESYWAHIGRHSLAVSDIVNSGTTSLLTGTMKF
nr:TonB-dependent receptor [Sphingomonas sp. dw_22]